MGKDKVSAPPTQGKTAKTSRRNLSLDNLPPLKNPGAKEYQAALKQYQIDLLQLQRQIMVRKQRVMFVFEGMDAAGKGGVIKRVTMYLDPRGFEVHSTGPPSPDERGHHYLRRFWLRLPPRGRIALFDRSWYGRLLVEEIEGFLKPEEYARAPEEVREFERLLHDDGYIIVKFWLHVSPEEQLKRFQERENDPLKNWKLTPDDWRNREHYAEYVEKANFMFRETDADYAPWWLLNADNKEAVRLAVLGHIMDVMDQIP